MFFLPQKTPQRIIRNNPNQLMGQGGRDKI